MRLCHRENRPAILIKRRGANSWRHLFGCNKQPSQTADPGWCFHAKKKEMDELEFETLERMLRKCRLVLRARFWITGHGAVCATAACCGVGVGVQV